MRSADPLIFPSLPSRRVSIFVVATLTAHLVVIWLMLDSRLIVDRQEVDREQEPWIALRQTVAPEFTSNRVQQTREPSPRRISVPLVPIPPIDPERQLPESPPAAHQDGNLAGPASSATPPLDLRLPPHAVEQPKSLTPAQEAMRDPRSNTLRLTRDEKLLLAFGQAECIAWQRMPDGSIYRGPGHLHPSLDVPPRPDGTRVMECVR